MKKSTASSSYFLSFSNDTRLLMDNLMLALFDAFVEGSLPHQGTSLRLLGHTPTGFSMRLSYKRLILYENAKSAAYFIGGLLTGVGRRHLRSVFKKQIGGTKIAGLSQK